MKILTDSSGNPYIDESGKALKSTDPALITKTITENGNYSAVDDGVDGYSSVSVDVPVNDPWEKVNAYLTNTLTKFRTMINYPAGIIVPGSANQQTARNNIEYWEMPNRTAALEVWGYAYLTKLKRFDGGKTSRVDNVSFQYDYALEQLILRKSNTIATLHSSIPDIAKLRIYVPSHLIEEYKTATNWVKYASKFRNLYIAETIEEKEQMLTDPTIPAESMIVCDVDATYTVKEE